ncbi:MAG: hypothetical protein WCD86_12420, partial [Ktedonobacteraceae bacterium]
MEILQQYYTSFVNKQTGSAGFQVQAMSPGISAEIQAIISRMVAYRIPIRMDEQAIGKHPVALRYYYHDSERLGILVCSQSSGRDESGRPGNFFAHSVVIPAEQLTSLPPILYWHSPFWKKHAYETANIAPLSEFSAEPSWSLIDDMWAFLADEARHEAFYKLMSAVVHSASTQRHIIIIDTDEHVALWVAAVCNMLPPSYRPLLSFATYHHDPFQSWFLITGTPDASWMHGAAEGHLFILDGQTNKTSEVESSDYANLVKRTAYTQEGYKRVLLQHFIECEKRFPAPTCLDEQLDKIALYVWLRKHPEATSLKTQRLDIITTVLSSLEQLPELEEDDWQELNYWLTMLGNAREASPQLDIQQAL